MTNLWVKSSVFIALMFSALSGCGNNNTALESTSAEVLNPELLQQTWFWSVGENNQTADSVSIFRPASYDIPRARGVSGFTIFEDEVSGFKLIVNHFSGPADGLQHSVGKWQLINENQLRSYHADACNPNSTRSTVVISEIIELSEDILKLKLISREEK